MPAWVFSSLWSGFLLSFLLSPLCSSHTFDWLVDVARRGPERFWQVRAARISPELVAGVWLGEGLTRVVGAGGTSVRTFPWWLGHGAWSFSGVACGDGNNSGSVDPDCSVRRRRSWSSAVNPMRQRHRGGSFLVLTVPPLSHGLHGEGLRRRRSDIVCPEVSSLWPAFSSP